MRVPGLGTGVTFSAALDEESKDHKDQCQQNPSKKGQD